jgi:hypothetical protein
MLALVALGSVSGMVFSGHLKGTEAVAFIGTGLVSAIAGRLTAPPAKKDDPK